MRAGAPFTTFPHEWVFLPRPHQMNIESIGWVRVANPFWHVFWFDFPLRHFFLCFSCALTVGSPMAPRPSCYDTRWKCRRRQPTVLEPTHQRPYTSTAMVHRRVTTNAMLLVGRKYETRVAVLFMLSVTQGSARASRSNRHMAPHGCPPRARKLERRSPRGRVD